MASEVRAWRAQAEGDKKTAVLEAIIGLLESGTDIYRMKVADIAVAAGMGKGTVYDYFTSKEEMIAEAVLYSVRKMLDNIGGAVERGRDFEEKFMGMLDAVQKSVSGMAFMNALTAGDDMRKLQAYFCEKDAIGERFAQVDAIILKMVEAGVREGVIARQDDYYYTRMTVLGAVAGYCMYVGNNSLYPDTGDRHARQAALRMLVNAFSGA